MLLLYLYKYNYLIPTPSVIYRLAIYIACKTVCNDNLIVVNIRLT